MQKELKLGIAGIIISVMFEDKNQRFGIDESYKCFATISKPAVTLYAHYGHFPKSKLGEKIFDTGTTWSFYQSNGKYILKTSSKIVILKSDFKSGDIYIQAQRTKNKREYPLSYPLDEILMINLLAAQEQGVMIHSCGVSSKGEGLLFAGTSRSGKSTMANLWKREKDATILSDDRIIIRKIDRRFWLYGTPWHGDAKMSSPERAPLENIFFLKHAENNSIKRISPVETISRLVLCSFPTFWDKEGMAFTLKFCAELAQKIPCYELGFVPNESVLDFVRGRCGRT